MTEAWAERDFVGRDQARAHERAHPEQWERYRFAARWLRPGQRVLDIACGSGFGTDLLSKSVGTRCLGLDIAESAVEWANGNFGDRADFMVASAGALAPLNGQFDAAISIETLEHMPQREGENFLADLNGTLRPGGLLVLSTPLNDGAERFKPANPFHIREYSWDELADLVADRFVIERRYSQISRLACLRRLVGGAARSTMGENHDRETSVGARQSLRGWVAARLRGHPFWRAGRISEQRSRYGGVQIIVARKVEGT